MYITGSELNIKTDWVIITRLLQVITLEGDVLSKELRAGLDGQSLQLLLNLIMYELTMALKMKS